MPMAGRDQSPRFRQRGERVEVSVFIREGGAHPQAALGVHWPTLGHCLGVTWVLNSMFLCVV